MRWLPMLRLLRAGTLFSPGADVVASAAIAGLPWDADLLRAIAASICLYAAGMVWNDIADRHVDARQRLERPLVRGDLSLRLAIALGIGLLAGGLAASPCRAHHGLIALLVLVYDFGNKRVAWFGALVMGGLRALNLGTALAMNAALSTEVVRLVLIAAGCYGAYIVAVTLLGILEDTERVRGRAVAAVQTAPPIAALCGLYAVQGGLWPAPAIAAVPILFFLRRNSVIRDWDQQAIRRSMFFLLLGTMLYTGLLALAAGRTVEAIGILAAIAPARWIARTIALT